MWQMWHNLWMLPHISKPIIIFLQQQRNQEKCFDDLVRSVDIRNQSETIIWRNMKQLLGTVSVSTLTARFIQFMIIERVCRSVLCYERYKLIYKRRNLLFLGNLPLLFSWQDDLLTCIIRLRIFVRTIFIACTFVIAFSHRIVGRFVVSCFMQQLFHVLWINHNVLRWKNKSCCVTNKSQVSLTQKLWVCSCHNWLFQSSFDYWRLKDCNCWEKFDVSTLDSGNLFEIDTET